MTKERITAIFGSVLLMLAAWNLKATRDNSEMVARMEERQIAASRIYEGSARDITELRARITSVEIQFAELRRSVRGDRQ